MKQETKAKLFLWLFVLAICTAMWVTKIGEQPVQEPEPPAMDTIFIPSPLPMDTVYLKKI